jgi:hypothetical protein
MSYAISLETRVVASKGQVSSELGGEVVILDLKAGVYHGLDGTGTRIWTLLQEPRLVSDIRDTIIQEYDVEPERCESDLLGLLDELAAKGLVEIQPATVR